MQRLFRPAVLIPAWVVLSGIALALVLLPAWQAAPGRAVPRPVPAGDQEVVLLNQATNAVAWERFVAALRALHEDADSGVEIVDESQAFPSVTTAVPELAVRLRGQEGRVWFRWYKLTGDIDSSQWVQALVQRVPPPLAIIGGSTSDRARDLARELRDLPDQDRAPLLLILTATADQVDLENDVVDLMTIYPRRSFRFCFTNRQMAEAVADFLWDRPDLRPDVGPVYLVQWNDDAYSVDLMQHFHHVLAEDRFTGWLEKPKHQKLAVSTWAALAGRSASAASSPGVQPELALDFFAAHAPYWRVNDEPLPNAVEGAPEIGHNFLAAYAPFWRVQIEYSIGGYGKPNRAEAAAAANLMNEVAQHAKQRRPLLILPAGPQPARRFLHGLFRISPEDAARFVVATGDLDFNSIYRDRLLAWPIQDLPVDLVLFCHRNPVDPIGFVPRLPDGAMPDLTGKSTSGTMDLLLYRDIAETVLQAAYEEGRLLDSAELVRKKLRRARLADGQPRFDQSGNLRSGSGEYVVWLRPLRERELILPRAALQVWNRSTSPLGERHWQRVPVDGLDELIVDYQRHPGE